MHIRGRKSRWLAIPVLGFVLFLLFGCGFRAQFVTCTPTHEGATYSIKVTSEETDRNVTARLLVTESKGDMGVDGTDQIVGPGEFYVFEAKVPKGKKLWVGVKDATPHANGDFEYHEELPGKCPA